MKVNDDTILLKELKRRLEIRRNPAYAKSMKAYMKNKFEFIGINAPAIDEELKIFWRDFKPELTKPKALISLLWQEPEREYQMFAIKLIKKTLKQYNFSDLGYFEGLIKSKSWWDTVDFLATTVIGHILSKDKKQADNIVRHYISSPNIWIKRTALLYQLKYKQETDASLLYELILSCLNTKEFFINKACGWALRQYSKINPDSVREFIAANKEKLASLTIREGSKYL